MLPLPPPKEEQVTSEQVVVAGPVGDRVLGERGGAAEVVPEESEETPKERQRREKQENRGERLLKTTPNLKTAKVRYKAACDICAYSPDTIETNGLFIYRREN